MKRYDQSEYGGDLYPSDDGDWVLYYDVEEIAKRLEKLAFDDATPTAITIALNAIINEIRGKE